MSLSCKNASTPLRVMVIIKRVLKLQRILMKSWSNRVVAVRRVTQDNTGKKTAGVDATNT
ncbi:MULTISPECIES: reverse transcriptase N-terminal domain-containing protein [Nostoc]|uniref:reverse transcriptase N-terminal domain-containing protein n=1 Tax=Nostoc TaxID=1177 RepID=UPI0028C4492C|nr:MULTISPECIES: reverse transcriptase N-terminal domain-containing protein [Nostoc]